mgnify:CR=1 FL=1
MNQTFLVTGGTGFLATHLIMQLLARGLHVRTTVRSAQKEAVVIKTLQTNHARNIENLTCARADLLADDGWTAAVQNVDGVFSVASPVFFGDVTDTDAILNTSREGTLRILRMAQKLHVRRVIMTANFGAVGFTKRAQPGALTTAADWTDAENHGLSIYEKSKLLAEKAAWAYVQQPDVTLEFATINPVAIFGPALGNHVSGSFDLLTNLLNGSMKRIPNLPLNLVDVRDVADAHIRAMLTPEADGQRFIVSNDGQISLPEIAQLMRTQRPALAEKVTTKKLPNWLINLGAPFNAQARAGALMIHMNRNMSNERARTVLGWTPRADNEALVLTTIDSLHEHGII